MKKLLILPAALLFAGIVTKAQDAYAQANTELRTAKAEKKEAKKELHELEGGQVGVMVKDHFYTDFGTQKATWKRGRFFDEASFVQDGKATVAYYDADASLVGTTTPSKFSELPQDAQNSIQKHYKGYTIDKVILFDDNETNPSDMVIYGSAVSDEDNYFVEMTKNNRTIILKVDMEGAVSFFTDKK